MRSGPAAIPLALLLFRTANLDAQEVSEFRRRAASLVVAVQGKWNQVSLAEDSVRRVALASRGESTDTATSKGSGIVIGMERDTVFIVTAAHLLTRGKEGGRLADTVFVAFAPERLHQRRFLALIQPAHVELEGLVDLALLRVVGVPDRDLRALRRQLPFWRVPRQPAEVGDPVYPLGCALDREPGSACLRWTPDVAIVESELSLRYVRMTPGYSGGGVFSEDGEVLAMIVAGSPTLVAITPIDTVLIHARRWGAPVRLRRARIPLHGYRISGLVALAGGSDAVGPASDAGQFMESTRTVTTRAEFQFGADDGWFLLVGHQVHRAPDARVGAPFIGVGRGLRKWPDRERHGGLRTVNIVATTDIAPFADVHALLDVGGFTRADSVGAYTPALVSRRVQTWGATGTLRAETVLVPHLVVGGLVGLSGYGARGMLNGLLRRHFGGYLRYGVR
jgi:hypothetical protein